jgi:hypothetical protein
MEPIKSQNVTRLTVSQHAYAQQALREHGIKQLAKIISSDVAVGAFVETKPGIGTLYTIREVMPTIGVLNCFEADAEFLCDLDVLIPAAVAGKVIVFDVHETKFRITLGLSERLDRIARQGGRFVFVSKHYLNFGDTSDYLAARIFRDSCA